MTPDPAAGLAKFTPAPGPDPADLLYRMGRASAPTPLRWKLAVAALLATNAAAVAWIALRPAPPIPVPVVVPVPVVEPAPPSPPDPNSLAALRGSDLPPAVPLGHVAAAEPMLTPLAARRGEID